MSGGGPTGPRPFRFGFTMFPTFTTGAGWAQEARRARDAGVGTLSVTDHFAMPDGSARGGVWTALMAAHAAAPDLRVGTMMLGNDHWNPAVVAREAVTAAALTDGRFELGIGAGWDVRDYEAAGLLRDRPGERIDRLEATVDVLDQARNGEAIRHPGPPVAVAAPGPFLAVPAPFPLVLGGGGRRVLELAARRADVVSVHRVLERGSPASWGSVTAGRDQSAQVDERIGWVRSAAGDRLAGLDLHVLLLRVRRTDHRREDAAAIGAPLGLGADDVLASPHFLVGSVDAMVETLEARRDRWGFNYLTLTARDDVDDLAAVISHAP